MADFSDLNIVLLSGGVGGARMAAGLAAVVPAEQLTIIVNTGDDFHHWGLTICPDIDTVLYTLSGQNNLETGWGRAGESWRTLETVRALGGPDWFRLGDTDLATHLTRTHWLNEGVSLTEVTRRLATSLGIGPAILPMCDQPLPTQIDTGEELLGFQDWFVLRRWQPPVRQVVLPDEGRATVPVMRALNRADVVIIAPSNPYVSVDPILETYPIRGTVEDVPGVVVAVSPIVGGDAVKGPLAKMLADWDRPVSPVTIADHYGDLLDGFVYDQADAGVFSDDHGPLLCTDTMMVDGAAQARLAREILTFALELR
ncbi:MAG: 2-phospho-L-lactate transferase [Anaerolineales bacterium]|nr:2-phospho-L-lactate transferase [Anaerolineales bacterium]